jgi:hypothetical protein
MAHIEQSARRCTGRRRHVELAMDHAPGRPRARRGGLNAFLFRPETRPPPAAAAGPPDSARGGVAGATGMAAGRFRRPPRCRPPGGRGPESRQAGRSVAGNRGLDARRELMMS